MKALAFLWEGGGFAVTGQMERESYAVHFAACLRGGLHIRRGGPTGGCVTKKWGFEAFREGNRSAFAKNVGGEALHKG